MPSLDAVGADWVIEEVEGLTDEVVHISPSQYNEDTRYLPESVSSIPGPLRYAVNPFMREIVDCFDVDSPVREVNLKKGVQITYSTVLESGALYFIGHIKTLPIMYITADKELATARIENNFIPMLHHSELGHVIRSSDEGNSRKTGNTAKQIQFEGGGYLVPFGAKNADKMRAASICIMLEDEIDGWPLTVGKDGDPIKLCNGRCKGYWDRRKIFRGSTPLIKGTSKIDREYLKGDQRKYMVLCLKCRHPQELRWSTTDKHTGVVGGFTWELDEGTLLPESVRYQCQKCGHPHQEHDKERLYSPEHGAHWKPTARPAEPGIRSYHLPAMYSPIGMAPWYSLVAEYLDCWDVASNKVKDVGAYQVFYNNVLAEPFEVMGSRIRFTSVSAHRLPGYRLGAVPNVHAQQFSGSPIRMLICTVDVHKSNLAVAVFGVCEHLRTYVIDYWRFEDDDCTEITSPVWARLRTLIEETTYTADDGQRYRIGLTLVDAGYANDTVNTFCSDYAAGVFPILGRDAPSKKQTIKEFAPFVTAAGTTGYRIIVDHYKERLAPVLRREWSEGAGDQDKYHFNAPVDITDKQLKELTVESKREKVDPTTGVKSWFWYRPSGANNELWDSTVYCHAAAEIFAYQVCIEHFELETVDWARFWVYAGEPENDALFGRLAPE